MLRFRSSKLVTIAAVCLQWLTSIAAPAAATTNRPARPGRSGLGDHRSGHQQHQTSGRPGWRRVSRSRTRRSHDACHAAIHVPDGRSDAVAASRGRLVVVGALILLLSGCGSSQAITDSSSGTSVSAVSAMTASASLSPPTVSQKVDIGGGRTIYAECAGVGSPTVLLESGDEADHTQWSRVAPTVAEQTRTCSYDRLGTGESDDPVGCREMKDLRGDLEAVLKDLGEEGPYVLVGTSGGGFLMAGFAYEHPTEVAGIVLVETPKAIIPEEAPLGIKCQNNVERRDYVTVENDAWNNRHLVGDIPMTVITNDYGDRTNVEDQKGWLVLSPQAKQLIVTNGHNVPATEPALVADEILKVVQTARAG